MNKDDVIALFARCPEDTPLSPVVRDATDRLRAAGRVRVVCGEAYPCVHYRDIYAFRYWRLKKLGKHVPGLQETVGEFNQYHGQLVGCYAETESTLIYFWISETGDLVGCVYGKPRSHNAGNVP